MKATPDQTAAFDVKSNDRGALYCRRATGLGTLTWAHFWAHESRFSPSLIRIRKKTSQGDGFFDRRLRRNSQGRRLIRKPMASRSWAHSQNARAVRSWRLRVRTLVPTILPSIAPKPVASGNGEDQSFRRYASKAGFSSGVTNPRSTTKPFDERIGGRFGGGLSRAARLKNAS